AGQLLAGACDAAVRSACEPAEALARSRRASVALHAASDDPPADVKKAKAGLVRACGLGAAVGCVQAAALCSAEGKHGAAAGLRAEGSMRRADRDRTVRAVQRRLHRRAAPVAQRRRYTTTCGVSSTYSPVTGFVVPSACQALNSCSRNSWWYWYATMSALNGS